MEIVAQFPAAEAGEPLGASSQLSELLRSFGAALAPMHPGTSDPLLRLYYTIRIADPARAEELAARLRALPGTMAAYVKPAGEPP